LAGRRLQRPTVIPTQKAKKVKQVDKSTDVKDEPLRLHSQTHLQIVSRSGADLQKPRAQTAPRPAVASAWSGSPRSKEAMRSCTLKT